MLNLNFTDIGIVFSVNIYGQDINFKDWADTDDAIYYFPLATLVDNGEATFHLHECILPYASVYLLDQQEQILLGIPPLYDKAMRMRGEGMLNTLEFCYRLELLSYVPDGELLPYEKKGNIVEVKGRKYLLNEYQYELFNRVEAFNHLDKTEKTTENNLQQFAHIKELALHSGCELDSYLMNENVYLPEKIKLELGRDEEGITIKPSLEIPEADKFTYAFEKMRKVQSLYPVQNEKGERRRILLKKEQQECLIPLKEHKCRFKNKEEAKKFIEQPTEYFDPDLFDLSEFYSDRVIEIGLYKPKFYPFVCPYKSCWIAGANVKTREGGTARIEIMDEEMLEEFRTAIKEAEAKGLSVLTYQGAQIDMEDARFLERVAEKQLKSPKNQSKRIRKMLQKTDNRFLS